MGSLCIEHLNRIGHNATAIGRATWEQKRHELKEADLVIISVPIDATDETILRVAPELGPDTVLSDLTSIKEQPVAKMCDAHPGPVLGLHPVFGPSITDAHNQVIVHCPGRRAEEAQWIVDAFTTAGFSMVAMAAKTHDQFMTFIQALKHFSAYCLGTFLHKQNIDLDTTRKIASPIYRLEMDMVGRIFSQSPDLYADIIMADEERLKMVRAFVDHIDEACTQVETHQRETFIKNFQAAANWMGEFTQTAMAESDRVIKAVDAEPQ